MVWGERGKEKEQIRKKEVDERVEKKEGRREGSVERKGGK